MAGDNKKLRRELPVSLMCFAAAAVLVSGVVTIGAMNLFCTDSLYLDYSAAFTRQSVINGAVILAAVTAAVLIIYNGLRLRHGVCAALCIAAAARICAALFWRIEPESDFLITYDLAKLLSRTPFHGWGNTLKDYGTSYNGIWASHMPFIIYQSLLLHITENTVILRLANAVFSWGACVLTALSAKRIGGEKAQRAVLTFMILNPAVIFFIPVLTNQHVSQFFLMLAVWIFLCSPIKSIYVRAWLAGAALGISRLMRPDIAPVIIAVTACVFYSSLRHGGAARKITVYAVGLCALITVIVAANTILVSSRTVTKNIYSGNLGYKIMVGLNRETNGGWSADDSSIEGDGDAIRERLKERLREPVKLIPMLYGKTVYQCGSYVYTWSYRKDAHFVSQNIMRRCGAALMIIVCLAAAWNIARTRRREMYRICTVLFVYMLTYAVIEVQARYNFVFLPFIILAASLRDGGKISA